MDQVLSLAEFQSNGFDVAQVIAKLVDGLIQRDESQSQAGRSSRSGCGHG